MMHILQPLVDGSIKRSYSAGSTIIYQGEAPRAACVLVSGVARVSSISKQGDEQIVMFLVEGEFFPLSWIFEKTPISLFFYEAMTDCEVVFVPRVEFMTHLHSTQENSMAMVDYFAKNYTASLIRINALEQPKARDKLVYTLYFLSQRYSADNGNSVKIPIALTHQHLASLVGLTRETAAMEMSKLKKQAVIRYLQQHYTVNVDRLIEIMGEDSFRGISITESSYM